MFTVRPFEARTISWWFNERDSIDLNPPYQRKGRIWTDSDKAFLIDSIVNGFDIPKIYLADFSYSSSKLNKNNKAFAVIDGKQRFEAIFSFLSNELKLDSKIKYYDDPNYDLNDLNYFDLKLKYPKLASKIENFNLSVMSVITDDEGLINDLFVRLNRSRPLNGAEIRNAMRGIVPDLFRKIVEHDFFVNIVSFNVKRKADLNIAAKLLLLEYRGELVDTKRVQLDRFVEDGIQLESSDIQSAFDRVIYVLDKMSKEFINDDPVLKLASGIPVYYWYFRNIDNVIGVRDKIIKFEKLRKINKEKASQGLNDVDDKIQKFDYYNRSPDDATSHEFRYKILCEYLNII